MEAHQVSEVFESRIKNQTDQLLLISPSTISTDPEIREQLLREIKHSHKLEGNTTRLSDYQTFESDYDRLTSNFGYPSIEKTVAGYLVQWLQQNGGSGVEHWINVPYLGWDGLQITPDDILRQSTENSNPIPLDGDHFLYKAKRLYQISEDYKQLRRRSKKNQLTKVQLDKIQNWIQTLRALFTYSDLSPLEKYVRQPDHGGFNDNSIRTQPQLSTSSIVLAPAYSGLISVLELELRLLDCPICGRMVAVLANRINCSEDCTSKAKAISRKNTRQREAKPRESAYKKVIRDIVSNPANRGEPFEASQLCQKVDLKSIPNGKQRMKVKAGNLTAWLSRNEAEMRTEDNIIWSRTKNNQKIFVYKFYRISRPD